MLDFEQVVRLLVAIAETKLDHVALYTQYALMVPGPERLRFASFFQAQAIASLVNAQDVSNLLLALNERPVLQSLSESIAFRSSGLCLPSEPEILAQLLQRSLHQEEQVVHLYQRLLEVIGDESSCLEDFAVAQLSKANALCGELRYLMHPQHPAVSLVAS